MSRFDEWQDLCLQERGELRGLIYVVLMRSDDGLTASSIRNVLERDGSSASFDCVTCALEALRRDGGATVTQQGDVGIWRATRRKK